MGSSPAGERALGTNAETLQLSSMANVYKGAALAAIGSNSYLYAANFKAGTIDVLKGNAGAPDLAGSFVDPNLPSGYAPFNVQNLGGQLFVAYAVLDANTNDEVPGAGNGIVDQFDAQGNLLNRIATGGDLNAPWGLAIAPSSFGALAGDLLVGNFGDGENQRFRSDQQGAFWIVDRSERQSDRNRWAVGADSRERRRRGKRSDHLLFGRPGRREPRPVRHT